MNLEPYVAALHELTEVSSSVILPYYGRLDVGVERKADHSPVTLADQEAELAMRNWIERKFPGHGILGEEHGTVRADAEFVWVLDPIDGTKSFITGVPLFTTLIGLLHEGRPILGAIHQPVLRQLMIGDGRQTTLNGRAVRVRPMSQLAKATLLTSDALFPGRYQSAAGFTDLSNRVQLYRTFGDGYGYLLVASGWADLMMDPIMNAWDLLPLIPCLEGAGAKITDWQGRPTGGLGEASAVACQPELHEEVIRILNP
jgi:histidinol phosphatase-like enzyme (inositol monophosphatase family)